MGGRADRILLGELFGFIRSKEWNPKAFKNSKWAIHLGDKIHWTPEVSLELWQWHNLGS
jgi:hypothetical protein